MQTTSCVRKRIICFINDSLPKSFWIWKTVRDSITRKLDCACVGYKICIRGDSGSFAIE
nr:hypothetical protein GZ9E5_3 [uncultured archaeon GZfos9E5]